MKNIFKRTEYLPEFIVLGLPTSMPAEYNITNIRGVLDYICKDFKRSLLLTSTMIDEMTTLYGKHIKVFRNEHNFYIWRLEFDGEVFRIFSAKNYGTTISIERNYSQNESKVVRDKCIRFLKRLELDLSKVQS